MVIATKYDVDSSKLKREIMPFLRSGLDLRFALGESVRIVKKFSKKNFILSGNGEYDALNEKYKAQKTRRAGRELPILVGAKKGGESGRLRDSVIRKTSETIQNIGPRSAVFGTKVPYSGYVQRGTTKMPARPFLFISDEMLRPIRSVFITESFRQIKRVGLTTKGFFKGQLG